MKIIKSVDLFDSTPVRRWLELGNGWETSAANGQDVVVYTANWMAAYSTDSGDTFTPISSKKTVEKAAAAFGLQDVFSCDQVVIYSPRINNFIWVMQTSQAYFLAFATPEEIKASKEWAVVYINFKTLSPGSTEINWFDFPEVALSDKFLYMTFDVIGSFPTEHRKYAVGMRLSLDDIASRRGVGFAYFTTDFLGSETMGLRPAQNISDTGYFVMKNTESELGVIAWPEEERKPIRYFKVGINTCATEDWDVKFPDGLPPDWLSSTSKISSRITGLTRTGSQLWVAWSAARKVLGENTGVNNFPFPHIGMAIIDVNRETVENHYIWNPEFAYAWPSLATNSNGDVGLSCCVGGNKDSPQYVVTIISEPDDSGSMRFEPQRFTKIGGSITTRGAGGHYNTIRQAQQNDWDYVGSGTNQIDTGVDRVNHPYFVLFTRGRF
jgi:hypothetical protein